MARRYRIFISRRNVRLGQILQNTPEAKVLFEDAKRNPIFGLRELSPDVPVFLMNTYPSFRMAASLIFPELFNPTVTVGVARRLPNGRGYRVVGRTTVRRLLPNKNGDVYPFAEMSKMHVILNTLEKINRNSLPGTHANPWSVLGIDEGRPGGDMSVAARGYLGPNGLEITSLDFVNPGTEKKDGEQTKAP